MNILLTTTTKDIFLGLLFLVLFFIISVIVGVGLRAVYLFLKENIFYTEPVKKPPTTKPKRKPIKSIEINPDEVDRIVVKKN